ncbi:MAG: trypsin-like serine protease [Corynebacterium sp.]|nr:trypsin-like serine protease [Corynebacterium sp.]
MKPSLWRSLLAVYTALLLGTTSLAPAQATPSPVAAGHPLGNACMLGFSGYYRGQPAFLSAGHCFNPRYTHALPTDSEISLGGADSDLRGQALVARWAQTYTYTDYAIIGITGGSSQAALGYYSQFNEDSGQMELHPVRGVTVPEVGMEVCAQNYGGKSCGVITEATASATSGGVRIPVFKANLHTEPGDSGGAIVTRDGYAVGIVQGGPAGNYEVTHAIAVHNIPEFIVATA